MDEELTVGVIEEETRHPLDWKMIKMMAINRVGMLVKEDLVKWSLAIDYLEALHPELQEDEEYKNLLVSKKKECDKINNETMRIKEYYNYKFGEIVKRILSREPVEVVGKL